MIQLKTWVTNLMKLCARKDKSNTFLEPQEIENKLTITNSLISKNSIPSESTTGTVDSIEFRDATKNLLGAIECYRTLAEDLGIRLKLGSNYLGFRVSDEGIPTSFVNHPHDNGPDTQIATVKKVIDSVNQLRTELEPVITAEINQAIDVALEALGADLNRIIAVLSKIGWDFDSTPTQNSIHGITSGGVYSFINSRLDTFRTELINTIRNNASGLIGSYLGGGYINGPANYLKVKFGDEEWLLQWFVREGSASGSWPAGSYSRTPLAVVSPSWPSSDWGHYAVDHVDNLAFNNTTYSFEKYEWGGFSTIFAFGRTN